MNCNIRNSEGNLSGAGCKQLTADVAYISNVMGALEVPLSRDVVDISRLLSLPIDQYVIPFGRVPF